ncbi:MAG: hypothetical protein ACYCRD_10410 [Leptospirillum sp.]
MTHKKAGPEEMEGTMLPLMIEWANGEKSGYRLIDAAMRGLDLASDRDAVFEGLSALSEEMLSRMIAHAPGSINPIYWRQTISVDALRQNDDGLFEFETFPSIQGQNPISGWEKLIRLNPQAIRDAFRVFDSLREGRKGPMDQRNLRMCAVPKCGRYFIIRRGGQRESKACCKAHGNILSARRLRASPKYQERERHRNTERMRAVREAEKLVRKWIEDGKTPKERETLLRSWNAENGSHLGKRAFFNILEKGSGTPGTPRNT